MRLYVFIAEHGDLRLVRSVAASSEGAARIALEMDPTATKTVRAVAWHKVEPVVLEPGQVSTVFWEEPSEQVWI